MKTRNGFVSNSSSTSFIVTKDRKEEAIKMGLELISVSDIKKWVEQGTKLGIDFCGVTSNLMWDIRHLNDGDYITKPYDRDRAYEEGIDFYAFSE